MLISYFASFSKKRRKEGFSQHSLYGFLSIIISNLSLIVMYQHDLVKKHTHKSKLSEKTGHGQVRVTKNMLLAQ